MKKNGCSVLLLILLSVIFALVYQPDPAMLVLILCGCLAYAALCLIPHRYAAVLSAIGVSVAASIYDARFLLCMTPAVCAACALYAARSGNAELPLKKDGFFCTAVLLSAVSDVISVAHTLSQLHISPFSAHPPGRYDICAAGCIIALIAALLHGIRAANGPAGARKGKKAPTAGRAVVPPAVMTFAAAAVLLYWFTQVMHLWQNLWPAFLCVYATFTLRPSAAAAAPAPQKKKKKHKAV